jgi:hypothetical protein
MHRGTSLYYGRIEERGIRCCYHGWLFDVQGNCVEQPCEPDGGRHRDKARQPWYPLEEKYGLVFAYLSIAGSIGVGVGPYLFSTLRELTRDYRLSLSLAAILAVLVGLLYVSLDRLGRGSRAGRGLTE